MCKRFAIFINGIFLLIFISYAACLVQFPKINAAFFLMYDNSSKPNNFQIWWPILFQLSRNCARHTLVFLHELVNSWNNCTTTSLGKSTVAIGLFVTCRLFSCIKCVNILKSAINYQYVSWSAWSEHRSRFHIFYCQKYRKNFVYISRQSVCSKQCGLIF